jgi:hypothetical protein
MTSILRLLLSGRIGAVRDWWTDADDQGYTNPAQTQTPEKLPFATDEAPEWIDRWRARSAHP